MFLFGGVILTPEIPDCQIGKFAFLGSGSNPLSQKLFFRLCLLSLIYFCIYCYYYDHLPLIYYVDSLLLMLYLLCKTCLERIFCMDFIWTILECPLIDCRLYLFSQSLIYKLFLQMMARVQTESVLLVVHQIKFRQQ